MSNRRQRLTPSSAVGETPKHPLLTAAQAAGPPLEITDWSLDPYALETLLTVVDAGGETIVECGSGVSTILIGRLLRERGRGSLYAIEHDRDWAELGRARIAAEGLERNVTLIEAPLTRHPLAQPNCRWYSHQALSQLPDAGVDLLLVDGPPAPAGSSERSRYPALPVLAPRLAANARLILDDVERAGEAWVLDRWRREFGLNGLRRSGALALATLSPAL